MTGFTTTLRRAARGRYSPDRSLRAYTAAAKRAFDTVPYYREAWAGRGPGAEPVPLPDVDRLLPLLYPLAASRSSGGETPPWLGEPGELYDALTLTGAYRADRHLFEVRRALLDWTRIGPRGARYTAVLAADAEVADPEVRLAGVAAFRAAPPPALLGSPGQVEEFLAEAGHPGPVQVFTRRSLAELSRPPAPALSRPPAPAGPELLYDERLGYVGARRPDCGHAHLSWRRFHVRAGKPGLLFTALRRSRPTLVDVVPDGAAELEAGHCPVHGTPILVARETPAPAAREEAR